MLFMFVLNSLVIELKFLEPWDGLPLFFGPPGGTHSAGLFPHTSLTLEHTVCLGLLGHIGAS